MFFYFLFDILTAECHAAAVAPRQRCSGQRCSGMEVMWCQNPDQIGIFQLLLGQRIAGSIVVTKQVWLIVGIQLCFTH